MFTVIELLQSFVIAIVFIFLFRLQKELFSRSYFSTGDILSDIQYAPTKKSILIRILIILVFGIVANILIKDSKIVEFGMTLGSFLIVWPIFLSEENIDGRFLEKNLSYVFC